MKLIRYSMTYGIDKFHDEVWDSLMLDICNGTIFPSKIDWMSENMEIQK